MGYQLWLSPYTGLRRKGTTFRELEALFIDQITTKFITEPLYSCHKEANSEHVRDELQQRDFDYAGVIDDDKNVIGFCITKELNGGPIRGYLRDFSLGTLISDSTPLCKLFATLKNNPYAFVLSWNKVGGIVTIWDINKPVVRIYLFGIISLFELHINFWIDSFNPNGSWEQKITAERLYVAKTLLQLRQGNNNELTLLECLQLADKRDILYDTAEFLGKFKFGKKKFESLLRRIEVIRNEIAHSQNSIISNLEWAEFVEIVNAIERFLKTSDHELEEKVGAVVN